MELLNYAQASRSHDPVRVHVQRLIEVVGTPRFEAEFVKAMSETTRSEHVTAYAFSPNTPPRLLFAGSNGTLPAAKMRAVRYLAQYWRHDPASLFEDAGNSDAMALRTLPQDIDDSLYRHDCYTSLRINRPVHADAAQRRSYVPGQSLPQRTRRPVRRSRTSTTS